MDYAKHVSRIATPQSEPIPGTAQVENSAGGYGWAVDDWTRLRRFLILGTEGGSYYASERTLTREGAQAVERCIATDPERALAEILDVSEGGKAAKNDPAIFALALMAATSATRPLALSALLRVCRIGTHLFHFMAAYEQLRPQGQRYGRAVRTALGRWYDRPSDRMAYEAVKYQQRDGWSHRDVLRLAHPYPATTDHDMLYRWIAKASIPPADRLPLIHAVETIKTASAKDAASLIREFRIPREAVPTPLLIEPEVWRALLADLPLEATVRNLGVLTERKALAPMTAETASVVARLGDIDAIKKARLHPIKVLAALLTYASGKGQRGSLAWTPVQPVVDALDRAFYLAFDAVVPTGKRILLACDVSGSMGSGTVGGVPGLTPRIASAALALVTAAREPNHHIVGFSHELVPLPISPRQRLDDVVNIMARVPMGGTDCSAPMFYALKNNLAVDAFVILTDSETWAGRVMHPAQALREYRKQTGIPAKLVVVEMVSNGFTIADPNDAGMLDCVGMSTDTPSVIAEFIR